MPQLSVYTQPESNKPGFWGKVWNGVKAGGGQILTGTVEVIGGVATCTGVVSCVGGAVLITDGLSRMWSGGKDSIRGYQGEKTGYGSDDFVGQDFKALCGDKWGEACRNATVGIVSVGATALESRLAAGAVNTGSTPRAATSTDLSSVEAAAASQEFDDSATYTQAATSRNVPGSVAETSAEIQVGTKVYRIWGDGSGPNGQSWTTVDPSTVENYRSVAGLPDANTGRFVSEGILKSTEGVTSRGALVIYEGQAGGLSEVLIPDATNQVDLLNVYGVNPPF